MVAALLVLRSLFLHLLLQIRLKSQIFLMIIRFALVLLFLFLLLSLLNKVFSTSFRVEDEGVIPEDSTINLIAETWRAVELLNESKRVIKSYEEKQKTRMKKSKDRSQEKKTIFKSMCFCKYGAKPMIFSGQNLFGRGLQQHVNSSMMVSL